MIPILDPTLNQGAMLWAGQCLRPGEYLCSANQQYCLLFQAQDYNLVLYRNCDFCPLWNTQTSVEPAAKLAAFTMRPNGNLVIEYVGDDFAGLLWSSETTVPGAYAELRNDGSLVVQTAWQTVWLQGQLPRRGAAAGGAYASRPLVGRGAGQASLHQVQAFQ